MSATEKKTEGKDGFSWGGNAVFHGPVTFHGPMFHIHDNPHVEEHIHYHYPVKVEEDRRKEARRAGRPPTPIFNEGVDTERLAQAVKQIYDTYYRPASRCVEWGSERFDETDFLLSLYYVFVKRGISPSTLAAKPYYAFLTEQCGIHPQQGEKTFVNHLNKVVRTGKPFHLLTRELLAAETREGVMTPQELPRWQRMLAAAEEAVENYWEGKRENQG